MRAQKPETELRELRRELKKWKETANDIARDSNTYRARASRAEAEVAEWKRRFDLLLARTPEAKAEGHV